MGINYKMVTSSFTANAPGKGNASTQQGQRNFFHPAKEVLKGDVLVQKGGKNIREKCCLSHRTILSQRQRGTHQP